MAQRPRIEDYLAEVDESRRPRLLEELLRVEIELRRRAGEEPTAEEYRGRFPDHAAVVDAVFAPVPGQSAEARRDSHGRSHARRGDRRRGPGGRVLACATSATTS